MTTKNMFIRFGRPEEGPALTALALRSKALWGYSRAFLDACKQALTYDAAYVATHRVYVVESDGRVMGFCSLERLSDTELELGALFVEPGETGKGYGRVLVTRAIEEARALGASRLVIQGDPNARGFYLAMGATLAGESPSGSIAGRMIPLFHLSLDSE